MFLLAYRNLRSRTARTIFTSLAIALGVGMIFAMRIVGSAIDESAKAARASRLVGADFEVSSAAGAHLQDRLAYELGMRPEIEFAAPIYRASEGAPAQRESLAAGTSVVSPAPSLSGTGLTLLGVDPAHPPQHELAAGSFFSRDSTEAKWEVIVPFTWAAQNGIGVGARLSLITGDQTHDYQVVGLRKVSGEELLTGQPTAWLPIKTMQVAFDTPGTATSLLVWLKPGFLPDSARDSLQAALGSQFIVTTATGQTGGGSLFGTLAQLSLPFSSLAILLTGSFLVYNAFAISLTERRREIGQLRALGMTRQQVLTQTLMEALMIAFTGSGIGLLLGLGLGRGLVFIFVGILQNQPVPPFALSLDGALLALGVGVLTTLVVTFNLASAAGRVSPLETLQVDTVFTEKESWYMRWGWVGALVSVLGFAVAMVITLYLVANGNEPDSALTLAFLSPLGLVGLTLFGLPIGMRGGLWVADRFAILITQRVAGASGGILHLAIDNLARRPARAVFTTATVTLGLMLVVALAGVTLVANESGKGAFVDLYHPDFMLVRSLPDGLTFERFASLPSFPPLSPKLQTDLVELTSDADVFPLAFFHTPGYSTAGLDFGFAASLDIFRDNPSFLVIEGSWKEADLYFAAGPALTLPETAARRHNLHPGDIVEFDTLEGRVPFTVALICGPLPLTTSEIGAKYFHSYPATIGITAHKDVDKQALRKRVEEIARRHNLGLASDVQKFAQTAFDILLQTTLALFAGLTSLSSLIAALGIVNTLVASVLERQREIGTLRALGMSRAHVRALIMAEAGMLGLIGAVIGVSGGLAITFAFGYLSATVNRAYGIANYQPPMPWSIAAVALIVGPTIAVLAALWPADRAASVNPAEAMRAEGATGFLKPAKHLGLVGLHGLIVRLPLSAKLSFTIGLVFILTVATLTAVRVNYERQLLEDNARSLMMRQLDFMVIANREQFGSVEISELTPQTLAALFQRAGMQVEALQKQFQGGNSPYEFGLKYFFITDIGNKVVFSDRTELIGRVLTDTVTLSGSSALVRLTDWTGERVFEGIVPLDNKEGKRLGTSRIGISTEPIDNVIRDVIRSSLWTMLAALLVAVGFTVFFTRRALAPLSQIAEASHAVARGDLSRHVPETRWDEIGSLSRSFNDMVKGLNERERMRDLFGRYLSREVSEAVLKGRVTLEGERKVVTVLFCDMRGSTPFAEAHAPDEVMSALNQYFEVIILAVEAHGGIVGRFVGDAAVCFFGAPTEYRDHAERALQAALSMREGLAYLNQKRTALGLPLLRFGIGLNSGEVIAGATGSEERQEYTIIGDAVNVGARVEELNKTFKDQDILLSELTYEALGKQQDKFEFVDLGEVEIRGKSQKIRVFGLRGLAHNH